VRVIGIGGAESGWQEEWERVLAAAKREGKKVDLAHGKFYISSGIILTLGSAYLL